MQHKHHHHALAMLMLVLILIINNTWNTNANGTTREIGIGVILDLESGVGKVSKICIQMAIHDFYKKHSNHTTKIVPHFVDSKNDRVEAASAAIHLIKDFKVMAIFGPQRSSQADFVVDIGSKTKVPILTLATTSSLSPKENPYMIRVSQASSSQAQPIAALIHTFPWREVVFVYQEGDFGAGLIPSLSEALRNVNVQIKHPVVISPFVSDDAISDHLDNIRKNQTRVIVVHLLPELASRFFRKAKEAGMMQEGYAWIVTDVVTNLLHTVDIDMDSMQGVLGVKPYIPRSAVLKNFEKRFKRNNPTEAINVYGLWSYDATCALAKALERVGSATTFHQPEPKPVTDLDAIGTSRLGQRLLTEIKRIKLKGLSGEFSHVDRQLHGYQIVNIVGKEDKPIYLWTKGTKISNEKAIKWPGGSNAFPLGWEIPAKLKVGYPKIDGFEQFIAENPGVNEPRGFCVDVFKAVMGKVELPHHPSYEYLPYDIEKNKTSRNYKKLVERIYYKEFDVVIGDVTIRADRSNYADFTLPYTDSGVSMVVPVKKDERKNPWIFMRPLEKKLWLTTCGFFIYTGIVVWVLEHQVNKEFRGLPYKQVGMIFWFSFSTLVFAHKEKMMSNLSRFVVIVWIFVVLVLQSSYTASLTSILTVEQLQPDFSDIDDLMRQGNNVGYKEGSFVKQMLTDMGFRDDKLIGYSLAEYNDALSNGSVSAIFDELPYLKLFLSKYCNKYMMVGPTYKTAGFGFAFAKGSPLLPLVSKALLQVTESELNNITKRWLEQKGECSGQDVGSNSRSGRLSLDSFLGLFYIAGGASTSALIIYVFIFLYENKNIIMSDGSISQKLSAIAIAFQQEKQQESKQEANAPRDDNDGDLQVIENSITNPPPPPTPLNHQVSDDEAEAHNVVETRN